MILASNLLPPEVPHPRVVVWHHIKTLQTCMDHCKNSPIPSTINILDNPYCLCKDCLFGISSSCYNITVFLVFSGYIFSFCLHFCQYTINYHYYNNLCLCVHYTYQQKSRLEKSDKIKGHCKRLCVCVCVCIIDTIEKTARKNQSYR